MKTYLLDTNIISLLLRRDPIIEQRIEEAFAANETIVLSPIVLYEIRRGLLKRDSKKQMAFFGRLIPKLGWHDFDRVDWEQSAQLWAEREKMGRPIEDADLLIAAQVRRLNAILVTDNEKDFEGLGVTVENWRGSK